MSLRITGNGVRASGGWLFVMANPQFGEVDVPTTAEVNALTAAVGDTCGKRWKTAFDWAQERYTKSQVDELLNSAITAAKEAMGKHIAELERKVEELAAKVTALSPPR